MAFLGVSPRRLARQRETAEVEEDFPLMPVSRSDMSFDFDDSKIHGKRAQTAKVVSGVARDVERRVLMWIATLRYLENGNGIS